MGTSTAHRWKSGAQITPILDHPPDDPTFDQKLRNAVQHIRKAASSDKFNDSVGQPIRTSGATTTKSLCNFVAHVDTGESSWPTSPSDLNRVTNELVPGDLLHDAAVRRAVIRTLAATDREAQDILANGGKLAGDFLCRLYNLFHVELMTELLMHFLSESLLPGVSTALLRTRLGEWVVKSVAKLVPSPCAERTDKAQSVAERGAELAETAMDVLLPSPIGSS